MLFRSENFPSVILRPFLLYGPWQNYNRLIPQIIKSAIKNEVLNASPGEQMRDFCYIDDAIDAILCSINANHSVNGEIFNIGTGMPIKVRDLISTVFNMVGSGNVNFSAYTYKNGENMALYADVTKSKHILGWGAKTDLATGLSKTINFYNKQST
jgi:nucleoside-diphosphate-sugar epimerase